MLSTRSLTPPSVTSLALTFALPAAAGTGAAVLAARLGVMAIGAVLLLLLLPWFMQKPFRLYLWLVATWPVLSLYVHQPLPAGLPDLNYERVLVLVMVLLVMVPALAFRREVPGLGLWPTLYVAMQTISYAAWLFADGHVKPNLVIYVNAVLVPLAMYWLAKYFISSKEQVMQFLYALSIALVLVSFSGLYERAFDLQESPFPISTGTASGERYLDVPGGRAAGVTGNPAIYGAFMGVGVLTSACCFSHTRKKSQRFVFAALVVLFLYSLVVSFTRSAWVAGLVSILTAQFFIRNMTRRLLQVTLVVLVLLPVLAWYMTQMPPIEPKLLDERILESSHVSGRVERIQYGWDLFWQQPLLGRGAGSLDAMTKAQFPQRGFDSSHNTFLTMLVDGGLMLFISFAALSLFWVIRAFQVWELGPSGSFERSVVGVIFGIMLVFLLSGMALDLKYFGYLITLYWIAGALAEQLCSSLRSRQPVYSYPMREAHPNVV